MDPGSGRNCVGRRRLTEIESNPAPPELPTPAHAQTPIKKMPACAALAPWLPQGQQLQSVEACSAEQLPDHEVACAPDPLAHYMKLCDQATRGANCQRMVHCWLTGSSGTGLTSLYLRSFTTFCVQIFIALGVQLCIELYIQICIALVHSALHCTLRSSLHCTLRSTLHYTFQLFVVCSASQSSLH